MHSFFFIFYKLSSIGIQGNVNSFFTWDFMVVLDRFSWNLKFGPNDSITHYCCRYWKAWWNMFAYICCRWNFRILFTSISLFYCTFKIWINKKQYFISNFWCWLNSNNLVSSEAIITLQKSLFLHTFLWDSSFFCSKGMKTIQVIKITIIFWCNSS